MKGVVAAVLILSLALAALTADETVWEEFDILPGESVWASSVLEENLSSGTVRYAPANLFDGDPGTAWVEAVEGDGIGENVTFVVDRPVQALMIVSGFARSRRLFLANGRPRRLKITLIGGFTAPGLVSETDARRFFTAAALPPIEIGLADSLEAQPFALPWSTEEQIAAIEDLFTRFRRDYPFFAAEQAADIGFTERELRDEGAALREFSELALTAFGTRMLRLEIVSVYSGAEYRDTCLSEVEIKF